MVQPAPPQEKPKSPKPEAPDAKSAVWSEVHAAYESLSLASDRTGVQQALGALTKRDHFYKQDTGYANGLQVRPAKDSSGNYTVILPGDDSVMYKIESDGTIKPEKNPNSTRRSYGADLWESPSTDLAGSRGSALSALGGIARVTVDRKGNRGLFLDLQPGKDGIPPVQSIMIAADGSVRNVKDFNRVIDYPADGQCIRTTTITGDGAEEIATLTLTNPKAGQKEKAPGGTTVIFNSTAISASRVKDFWNLEKGNKVWAVNYSGEATLDRDGRHLKISKDANTTTPEEDIIYQNDPDYCSTDILNGEDKSHRTVVFQLPRDGGAKVEVAARYDSNNHSLQAASIKYTRQLISPFGSAQEFVCAVSEQIEKGGIDSLENLIKDTSRNANIIGAVTPELLNNQLNNDFKGQIRSTPTQDGCIFIRLNAQGKVEESAEYSGDGIKLRKDTLGPCGNILETTKFRLGRISEIIKYHPDNGYPQETCSYFADGKTRSVQSVHTEDGQKALTYAYALDGSRVSEMNWNSNTLTVYEANKDPQRFSGTQLAKMIKDYRSGLHHKKSVESKYKVGYNRFLGAMEATFGSS